MRRFRQLALYTAIPAALLAVGIYAAGSMLAAKALFLVTAICLAIGLGSRPRMAGYQYTAWIITAVIAGMCFPSLFLKWGEFDLRNRWLILFIVQAVMFGMGTQMSLRDFKGVAQSPKGVLVGLLCQFSIMPIVGFTLTKLFDFPMEIAAGIILIGSCSSGLASNVMTYLARANLVLSVTVTACATMAAPLMTPFLMKLLAGTLIEIRFLDMMLQIVKIVLVPIGAAMLHDHLKHVSRCPTTILKLAGISAVWLLFIAFGGWSWLSAMLPESALKSVGLLGFFAGAIIAGLTYHMLTRKFPRLDSLMPYASMFGIVYFTTVTTAAGRDHLMQVGILLFIVAIIHNAAGYFFGYSFSRLLGLDRSSARAMALEVGLQNGGMASGLAGAMGKLGTVGLASAVFSPWMNISGSILANIWRAHPTPDQPIETHKQDHDETRD